MDKTCDFVKVVIILDKVHVHVLVATPFQMLSQIVFGVISLDVIIDGPLYD